MVANRHSVLPLSLRSSFFRHNVRGCLADRHQILPHVRWRPRFIKFGHKFGWPVPLPPKFGDPKTSKFWHNFMQFHNLIVNISGSQQEIVNRKTKTMDTIAQAYFIWCTSVHKRPKVGSDFWPTQWAAIRLGITMHLVSVILFLLLALYIAAIVTEAKSWPHHGAHRWTIESHILC